MERCPNVVLYTVEISYGDRPFEVTTPDNPRDLQLRTEHELWHKENALISGFRNSLVIGCMEAT